MSDSIILGLNTLVHVVEIVGASILLLGFIIATVRFPSGGAALSAPVQAVAGFPVRVALGILSLILI